MYCSIWIWLQNYLWSCRTMNSASFDVCCLCFWKCLILAKGSNTYAVCSCLHTFAESFRFMYCSIWIWLQNCPWSCRAMNSASFDVCCLCFWKCLIPAKKIKTLMQFVRVGIQLLNLVVWCFVAFESGCRTVLDRVERWILHLLMCVVCGFENVKFQQKIQTLMQFVRVGIQLLNLVVWCFVAFESGCRTVLDRVERWILHLLMCVVCVFENV